MFLRFNTFAFRIFYHDYNHFNKMKKALFKMIAKINKLILPSYSKKQLDLTKATKIQLAIFGWRLYVTKRALD